MSSDQLIASVGLGELMTDEYFIAQIGMLSLTAVLFLCSLVLCLFAFRAAGAARQAKGEASHMVQSVQDIALEVRQLTAQAERASLSVREHSESLTERINSVHFGEGEQTPTEASDEIELGAGDEVINADADVQPDDQDEPKRPTALFRGFMRRR